MSDPSSDQILWGDKPYHSLDYELKKEYGKKIYKLSLNGGMSCPNRDGTIDTNGCIFCSEGGSGDFSTPLLSSVTLQIEEAKKRVEAKLSHQEQVNYIAYFQAYSNTHASVSYLRSLFLEAISHPDIVILSIATRPDCLPVEVLDLLSELNRIKPVWIELGLQTMHNSTALMIRRGYPLTIFEDAVNNLNSRKIRIIVHTILGLPKETPEDMMRTIKYISNLPIWGIKLQLLHILKGTELGTMFENGDFHETLTMNAYIELVIACLEHLPKEMVIHRITGDGPRSLLLSPLWSTNKKLVLNRIHQTMKETYTWQGKLKKEEANAI